MPRLAAIKLEGEWGGPPRLTARSVGMFLAGALLLAGSAVAGAAWLGGSLFDAREAFAAEADRGAASLGFAAAHIEVEGVVGARAAEVRTLVMPVGRASLLAADPDEIKARVESLDWVSHARIERRWPDTLRIRVVRRAAFARWQENGAVSIIDAAGERLLAERAIDHPELPLVVGKGAAHAAEPLLRALENLPEVRTRTLALVRVGERRWNLETRGGVTAALPEAQPVAALQTLEDLQRRHRLLDRPVQRVDLRVPGYLFVRDSAPLLGEGA
ncbi:MAG: cell division protein FtsQ/DivIB [Hyphomonadaceae bacterium]